MAEVCGFQRKYTAAANTVYAANSRETPHDDLGLALAAWRAVRAHADVCRGNSGHGLIVPIHWATFNLAFHGWSEPVRRLVASARAAGTPVSVPLPGQRIDANALSPQVHWWEDVV